MSRRLTVACLFILTGRSNKQTVLMAAFILIGAMLLVAHLQVPFGYHSTVSLLGLRRTSVVWTTCLHMSMILQDLAFRTMFSFTSHINAISLTPRLNCCCFGMRFLCLTRSLSKSMVAR